MLRFGKNGSAPQVIGVRETLAALKQLDPKLERQVKAQMRKAAQPLAAGVRQKVPGESPMSGWTRGRYGFDPGAARSGVKVKVGGRASGKKAVWPLVAVEQRNAGGAVFDMAGRRSSGRTPSGRAFIRNLNQYGRASRSMWPGTEDNIDEVRKEVLSAIDTVAEQMNRTINRR